MTNYERLCNLLCGAPTAYTPDGVAQWKKAGRYGKAPSVGAFIYFYSARLGRVGHVGIVASVERKGEVYRIRTVEGNTAPGDNPTSRRDGGKCMEHTYDFKLSQVGGTNKINGFGHPAYGADTCTAEQLIGEARSWVGYLEKDNPKADLTDKLASPGDGNCTIFGRWYGETVGDTATYTCAQWCSMYCCYCAYQAVVKAHSLKTGWIKTGDDWMYRKPDGTKCRDEWLRYGGRWYVFDGAGRMIRGWFMSAEGWYYMAGDGAMCYSQWIMHNAKCYYVTASGLMAESCYVRSEMPTPSGEYIYYWVGGGGAWDPQGDTLWPDLKTYYCAR